MKKNYASSLVFLLALFPIHVFATILPVPSVYATVQTAINNSSNGDTVLVSPGTYYENLNMNGMNVVLASLYLTTGDTAHISSTILDGNFSGRVLTIDQGENDSCQVVGFTIRNGDSFYETGLTWGGGIFIDFSSPVIRHCVIRDNVSASKGGGLAMNYSDGKVLNCTIRDNTADNAGGGVYIQDCLTNADVANCIITGNTIGCYCDWTESGGGVNIYHSGRLTNCLVAGNTAPNASVGGGGVFCDWGDYFGDQRIFVTGCTIVGNSAMGAGGTSEVITGGEFRNCIIWGNTDGYNNVYNNNGNTFHYSCSSPQPSGTANLGVDPQFVSPGTGNYRLSPGSPCINTGSNTYNSQTLDLDGNPRLSGNIDMGAYEQTNETGFTVQIGAGYDGVYQYPVNSCDYFSYTQQIYDSAEFSAGGGGPGFITRIRFYYQSGATNFSLWNNWSVYLGNTPRSEFASTSDWVPLDSMSLVFSGLIPSLVPDSWNEIILNTPFYYSGDNLVVAVDENSFGGQCSAVFAGFGTSAGRGLSYSSNSVNPDPAAPPAAQYGPDWYINQVQFFFNTSIGLAEGYVTREIACTDPVAGATVSAGGYFATTDPSGFYSLALPAGTYPTLTASDGNVNQSFSDIHITSGDTLTQDFCIPIYFAPPVQLEAEATGTLFDNAHLTWLEPGSVTDQYIFWGEQVTAGALGYGNMNITFSIASRWPVEDIAPFDGAYLKKVRFYPTEPTAQYTLKVWKGPDASTLLHSQPVPVLDINMWNDVALTTPVEIDGMQELWFGFEIFQTEGYPAPLAAGPAVAGKGDMFNSGGGWISMKASWDFNFNWLMQGFISQSPVPLGPSATTALQAAAAGEGQRFNDGTHIKPEIRLLSFNPDSDSQATNPWQPNGMTVRSPAAVNALLTGYNIYRDNVKIGNNVPGLSYDDPGLAKGTYSYEVSAQYDLGESERIGPVDLQIYTCFPPTGLSVPNASLATQSAFVTWTPSSLSTITEWVLEYGSSGFTPGSGTQVHVSATPQYSITGLTAGGEYDVYVSTVCSTSDTSARVMKRFRTHYFDCPAGADSETEACGDTINNGCHMPVPGFETIACGDTVCGSVWLMHQYRDSDWYSFTLTQTTDVTVRIKAEFNNQVGLKNSPCPSTGFIASIYTSQGWANQMTAQLTAGTYYIYVAPNYNGNLACDSLNRYILSMSCSTCLTPSDLSATNVTSTSAVLGWSSSASEWEVEWGIAGFGQGNGTLVTGVTQNPYTLTGLTEGHSYGFYVRSKCPGDEYSQWGGPYTFFVPCQTLFTLPFGEDFTGQDWYSTPLCWRPMAEGTPENWIVDPTDMAGGEYPELRFSTYPWSYQTNIIASPVINTMGRTDMNLQFDIYLDANSANSSVEVWTTSDGGQTWNTAWDYSTTGIYGPTTEYVNIWNSDVGSPDFQFAFVVSGNSWNLNTLTIDDIFLDGYLYAGDLDGYINECNTTDMLEGVMVRAGTDTVYTDNVGYFIFYGLPQGSYDVISSLTGYENDTVADVQVWDSQITGISTCLTSAGPPENLALGNITHNNGDNSCYDALQTITVAGSGSTFVVNSGASVLLIAGQKISYLPGAQVLQGGYMLGRIAPGGPFCDPGEAPVGAVAVAQDMPMNTGIRLYPNPTTGRFTLDLTGIPASEGTRIDIFDMRGEKVLSVGKDVTGKRHELSLEGRVAGIYLVRVTSDAGVHSARVLITR